MDQHGGGIALLPTQLTMRDGSQRHDGIAVLSRQVSIAQTNHQVVNQLGKMSHAFLVAKIKVVEFRGAFCPRQPICDQSGFAAFQYCSYALGTRRL